MDEADELQELEVTEVGDGAGAGASVYQLLPELVPPAVHHGALEYLLDLLLPRGGLALYDGLHGLLVL